MENFLTGLWRCKLFRKDSMELVSSLVKFALKCSTLKYIRIYFPLNYYNYIAYYQFTLVVAYC
jgi:hypothetical protein